MMYTYNFPNSVNDPITGSGLLSGVGSGSISGAFPGKVILEDFDLVVKDQLRMILADLFDQYSKPQLDRESQDRNMLIRHIYMITRLYHDASGNPKHRSKKNDTTANEDGTSGLITDELISVFMECMDRFVGNVTDIFQQLTIFADEDTRTEILEKIAQSFDDSFAPFTKFTGESYA